ncbi:MAG: antitoxin family protein [Candidatus Korarchaeota archaeon]|nr:antitoxin family protein [Candidatus Korarchaeota archaeon]
MKVIRVRYEGGVLRPLDKIEAGEGEVLLVKVIRKDRELADKLFGSLRVDEGTLRKVLEEAEDELGIY